MRKYKTNQTYKEQVENAKMLIEEAKDNMDINNASRYIETIGIQFDSEPTFESDIEKLKEQLDIRIKSMQLSDKIKAKSNFYKLKN
jgi:hypothetical protein